MKNSIISSGLLAGLAASAPLASRQSSDIDPIVLQFALTLEHLENVFYKGALAKFSAADFEAAGQDASYYTKLQYIAADEESHVKLLTSALSAAGAQPVAACQYNFPYTDVASFITLSSVLEGVGTSAYLGGAPLITSKDYLTVAGSILVTEALHTSFQRNAVGEVPFPTPYGTPLDPMSVYTLAAAFITSCPSTNAALPFMPFPSLTYDAAGASKRDGWQDWNGGNGGGNGGSGGSGGGSAPALPAAGSTVKFTAGSAVPAGSYVTFVSGLTIVSVAGTISGSDISAAIPDGIAGQVYVFVSSADVETKFDDSKVLFGPAIVEVQPAAPSYDPGYQRN